MAANAPLLPLPYVSAASQISALEHPDLKFRCLRCNVSLDIQPNFSSPRLAVLAMLGRPRTFALIVNAVDMTGEALARKTAAACTLLVWTKSDVGRRFSLRRAGGHACSGGVGIRALSGDHGE
jgi:hypothetical protein